MEKNYLITGYWGEPHVTVENDRGINAAIFGAGRFVLPVGNQFRAEYIGNNTVRVYDGKLIDNGAIAGIPAGQFVDLLIPETGQGMKRNDLIIFQYEKNVSSLVESGSFVVVSGAETEGTAADPELTQQDILSDTATFDQMALWRVPVAGSVISAPVKVFDVAKNTKNAGGVPIVAATSTDGINYEATVESVDELYTGFEITIIPNMTSKSTAVMLNVNGLGACRVRMPISSSTSATTTPTYDDFYAKDKPVKLIYDKSSLNGIWRIVDKNRANALDLYGTTPIEHGGTGADNVSEARENLEIKDCIVDTGSYVSTIAAGISWTYRKYSSGIAECWFAGAIGRHRIIDLPFDRWLDCVCNVNLDGYLAYACRNGVNNISISIKNLDGTVYAGDAEIHLHVIGKVM